MILNESRIERNYVRAVSQDQERRKLFVNPIHLPVEEVRLSGVECSEI